MILVDTSVWIDFLNGTLSREASLLEALIRSNDALCINGLIEMELLQGTSSQRELEMLRTYLKPFQYFPYIKQSYLQKSVDIYRRCRKKGKTIRKSIDCIIAANAIIDGLIVLHKDRDFESMAEVIPALQVLPKN